MQECPEELVVHCSPDNPPYALVCVLGDLIRHDFSLDTSCHFHSSVSEPVEDLIDFLPESSVEGGKKVTVNIIWKESTAAKINASMKQKL